MLKPQLVLVLQLLLEPLDVLTRFNSGRAGNGPPDGLQAGFFAVGWGGFKHGKHCLDVTLYFN